MDVWVPVPNPLATSQKYGRMEKHVSPIFGPLYVTGEAHGFEVGGTKASAQWFPSPTAVNHMNEMLGRSPGTDVLRFVHSKVASDKYGDIPNSVFANHLRNGEYPQPAVSPYLNRNYRNYDQNIGILLSLIR
jgi:hypothetical protein